MLILTATYHAIVSLFCALCCAKKTERERDSPRAKFFNLSSQLSIIFVETSVKRAFSYK
jgi:hypothetical protein